MAYTSFLEDPARNEVDSFLSSLEPITMPTLSFEGLVGLRDVIGTSEVIRALERLGLSQDDAFVYARQMARSLCSLLEQIRLCGEMDAVQMIHNALAIGYERGVYDASRHKLTAEGMRE